MNDISASLPSVEHFNNNESNESSAFGDAGSIVDKKITKFPLSDTCLKWSISTTKDERSFALTKDRTSSCSGDRPEFLIDSNHGPVKKAAVSGLDCAVSQREQVEAIKVTPSIVLSLAEDQDVPIPEVKDVGKVFLKDYVTDEQMLLSASEDAMHSNLDTIGVCDQLQLQSSQMKTNLEDRDVPILEVQDDENVFLKDYVRDDQMPLRAAEDAMHSAPETNFVCDQLGLQLNQMKTSLALLDSNFSSRSETPSENNSSTKLRESNGCEVVQGTYLLLSCDHIDQNAPTLEFSESSNLHKSLGANLVSEETKSAPLWTEESKGAQGATRQLNKVGSLVEVGRAGGANFSSQSIQDDRSLSEKWHVDTDAAECASTTFSGPIPFSGPISYSGAVSYSGLISYSGQIPYSGSISLRSESSTTSTRSFAFPILASEWNSSPVKMPQPDRRYLRRRWRWRCCCICCRRPSTLFD